MPGGRRTLILTTVVTRRSAASRSFRRGRPAICANSLLGPPDRSRAPRCRNGNAGMYSKGGPEAEGRPSDQMKEPVLATAANAVDHAVERCVLLVDWVVRTLSEGTWSARGWRCPTGASGSICWSEFTDGGAARFRGPAGCAIAAEPSTRASKAIIAINFLIMGLRVGTPYRNHGDGKLDRQAAASLTFCSGAPAREARRCRANGRPDCTKQLPPAHAKWIGRYDWRGVILSIGQFFPSGRCEHCGGLVVPVDGKCPGAIRCLECDPVDPLRLPWTAAWLASELRPPK
jgi:hypothetical protein